MDQGLSVFLAAGLGQKLDLHQVLQNRQNTNMRLSIELHICAFTIVEADTK